SVDAAGQCEGGAAVLGQTATPTDEVGPAGGDAVNLRAAVHRDARLRNRSIDGHVGLSGGGVVKQCGAAVGPNLRNAIDLPVVRGGRVPIAVGQAGPDVSKPGD